ncbi:Fork head transcription factor [Tubulinosema ratisbonensis]|uniref:Fork head transcription factor n=1 Tax=Tubulinosema ratisbonensis TaxID=291195 RepID=A0A437AIW4_9MICR|nr:Fork head transcription factor [Tubulinosema ratisbonensis]
MEEFKKFCFKMFPKQIHKKIHFLKKQFKFADKFFSFFFLKKTKKICKTFKFFIHFLNYIKINKMKYPRIKMNKKNVVEKNFTYHVVIREAIEFSPNQKATSAQIFEYMALRYPSSFRESNSATWKNNVRQLLSKCPEFVKTKKESNSKLHYWKFVPMEKYYDDEKPKNPSEYWGTKEPRYEYKVVPKYLQKYDIENENQCDYNSTQENSQNSPFFEDQINFNVNLPFFNPEYRDIYGRKSSYALEVDKNENSESDLMDDQTDIE